VGRAADLAAVETVLADARASRGGALVVRGEAGVGKTALLAEAARRAEGMTVLRAVGVESEAEFAFAGLHQVLAPGLGRVDALPAPQAAALRGAFGFTAERTDDRFLVSLGALGVLADLADAGPVLVLVDDAQWLDRPSAEALGFVARRLAAEPVAMLLAAREGEARRFEGPGLPELRLRGLGRDDARRLLQQRAAGPIAPHVAERLVGLTGGNPLALVELPAALDAPQLAGRAPLPDRLPLTSRLEHAFADRARDLDEPARRLLAVAVADDTGDLPLVMRAAARLDAGVPELERVEASGLATVAGDRLALRHPLARSVLQRGLPFALRQSAHAALAEVLDAPEDADRRAWHRAAATYVPDEGVAAELEHTAARAGARGGHAAAATALERAAQLSVDERRRADRLAAAAEAAWRSGRAPWAQALADQAEALAGDGRLRGRILSVRAAIAFTRGAPAEARAMLEEAAAATADTQERADLLVRAAEAAVRAGDGPGTERIRRRLDEVPETGETLGRTWLGGVGAIVEGRLEEAARLLTEVADRGESLGDPRALVWAANASVWLGDAERTLALQSRAIELARARGAFATVAVALTRRGAFLAWHGRVDEAWADGDEALRLTEEAGIDNSVAQSQAVLASVAALRGDEEACRAEAERALSAAAARGLMPVWETATWALGLLELLRGRHEAALGHLETLVLGGWGAGSTPLSHYAAVPELVEAAVRAGRPELAAPALERFTRWAEAMGVGWAAGLRERCLGLLAEGDAAIAHLERAHALHVSERWPLMRAVTQLHLGEALRRGRRRTEARTHLRAAAAALEAVGVRPLADRAQAELRATGEALRPREAGAEALTPQERRIARFVATGASNKEVASQLFLSPKTVEYHLAKVFQKLGIASRADLAGLPALGIDQG